MKFVGCPSPIWPIPQSSASSSNQVNGELCNSLGVSEEDLVMVCVEEDPKAAYFPRFQFEKKSDVDFRLFF